MIRVRLDSRLICLVRKRRNAFLCLLFAYANLQTRWRAVEISITSSAVVMAERRLSLSSWVFCLLVVVLIPLFTRISFEWTTRDTGRLNRNFHIEGRDLVKENEIHRVCCQFYREVPSWIISEVETSQQIFASKNKVLPKLRGFLSIRMPVIMWRYRKQPRSNGWRSEMFDRSI